RPWAESVMSYVKKNKPVVVPVAPKGTDTTAGAANTVPGAPPIPGSLVPASAPANVGPASAAYKYDAKAPHYYIFLFKQMESKAMGLKVGLNDFNTFKFSGQNLSSSLQMLQPTQGIVVVKSFPSATHGRIYMNAVKGNSQLFREYRQEEYQMILISEDNFRKLEADKDIQPYLQFYKANYK